MKEQQTKNHKSELRRIIEYMVSGGAFFWSGYTAFFILDSGLGLSLWWSTSVSYIIGWIVNYILQRYWVFNNPDLAAQETKVTARYVFISLVNLLINYAILSGLKLAGITPYIGQFISSGFFTGWNYFWYKYWVFPGNYNKKTARATRG